MMYSYITYNLFATNLSTPKIKSDTQMLQNVAYAIFRELCQIFSEIKTSFLTRENVLHDVIIMRAISCLSYRQIC